MPEAPKTDKSDHDILIGVATSLNGLCKRLETIDTDNKAEHKVIRELIDSNYKISSGSETRIAEAKTKQVQACNARFLPTRIFLWVAGFIIVGVIGAYSFTSIVQTDLNNHKITMNAHEHSEDGRVTVLEKEEER